MLRGGESKMVLEKGMYEKPKVSVTDVLKATVLPIPKAVAPTYVAPTYDVLKAGMLPISRDVVTEEIHTEIPSKFTSPYFLTGRPTTVKEVREIREEVAREQFVAGGGLFGEMVVEQPIGVSGFIEGAVETVKTPLGLILILGFAVLIILILVLR